MTTNIQEVLHLPEALFTKIEEESEAVATDRIGWFLTSRFYF
jgi:hypothetical protein